MAMPILEVWCQNLFIKHRIILIIFNCHHESINHDNFCRINYGHNRVFLEINWFKIRHGRVVILFFLRNSNGIQLMDQMYKNWVNESMCVDSQCGSNQTRNLTVNKNWENNKNRSLIKTVKLIKWNFYNGIFRGL